jgi:hypothetical protein
MTATRETGPSAGFPWWVLFGAVLLAAAYLPTLATRFDFVDDGNLVYPARAERLADHVAVWWENVAANYRHLGPFRPTLWAHWHVTAQFTGGREVGWRMARLGWCALAAGMLLWLMRELGARPAPALFAAAVAMWNPYRNEIWTSLTLSEGVAMPYALGALVCACRAARSPRPWPWDLAGALCVLVALGCKNTFAVLVPVQVFLRLTAGGDTLRDGLRRHGVSAALVSLTLLMPVAHFVYFKLNWRPGQYHLHGVEPGQAGRIVSSLAGALSLDFLTAGLVAAVVAWRAAGRDGAVEFLRRHRVALGAAALLLVLGSAVYMPIGAMSGRYTMPAVWGLDVALAVGLTGLAGLRPGLPTRVASGLLAVGLAGVLVASVGKQEKFRARAAMLWSVVEHVERAAPPGARLAWVSGDVSRGGLNVEEGIHVHWHLAARGRADVRVALYDDSGRPLNRCELPPPDGPPDLVAWGTGPAPEVLSAGEPRRFAARYWARWRGYECQVATSALTRPDALKGVAVGQ